MDRDIVVLLNYLYFNPSIDDEKTKQILHCYHDTVSPLRSGNMIQEDAGVWRLTPGVLEFLKMAETALQRFPPRDWIFGAALSDPLASPAPTPRCFAAMPYGPPWFPAVRDSIETAARASDYDFRIALDISLPGTIMSQVWSEMREAEVVVADLTGLNANVMYELGMAHALGKPTVLLTQDQQKLPFDVGSERHHPYRMDDLAALKTKLESSLGAVRQENELRSS